MSVCTDCAVQNAEYKKKLLDEAIETARRDCPALEIRAQIVLIVERINGSGYFWITEGDDRAERLTIVDRIYIH